ncbi:MAG: hypothetical protein AAF511_05425 [Pseudomonadota bacterium]
MSKTMLAHDHLGKTMIIPANMDRGDQSREGVGSIPPGALIARSG